MGRGQEAAVFGTLVAAAAPETKRGTARARNNPVQVLFVFLRIVGAAAADDDDCCDEACKSNVLGAATGVVAT